MNFKTYAKEIAKNQKKALSLYVKKVKLHNGSIKVNGYKHSMVQIICYSIAYNLKIKITNAPNVLDTHIFCMIIKNLGGYARFTKNTLYINPTNINNFIIDSKLSCLIHGSVYLMPALLIRLKKFEFYGAGGCQIGGQGDRPIEQIIDVMRKFGANIVVENNVIKGTIENYKKIDEIDIMKYSTSSKDLSGPLVGGATKTALLLSLNQEYIKILNPYIKTDVLDVLNFLQKIKKTINYGTNFLIIRNALPIISKKINFELTQCVSEIITYISIAVVNELELKIKNLNKRNIEKGLKPEFELLNKMNVLTLWQGKNLYLKVKYPLKAQIVNVLPKTIQSDHQPFFALMLTKADNVSTINEYVWESRFAYIENLLNFNYNFISKRKSIDIEPGESQPRNNLILPAKDVRTAAITLLGFISSNSTGCIKNAEHLFRGYDSIIHNLKKLGVKIHIKEERNENPFIC